MKEEGDEEIRIVYESLELDRVGCDEVGMMMWSGCCLVQANCGGLEKRCIRCCYLLQAQGCEVGLCATSTVKFSFRDSRNGKCHSFPETCQVPRERQRHCKQQS